MKKIKLIFRFGEENIFVLDKETDYTFDCFYYNHFDHTATERKVTFNKSRLLGWEFL